jgi:hypothetical protein
MERTAGKGTLVHFRCTNPAHARPAAQRSDTITLHEGLWAYCPFNVRAGDHTWVATGGVPIDELRRDAPYADPSGRQATEQDAGDRQ